MRLMFLIAGWHCIVGPGVITSELYVVYNNDSCQRQCIIIL